MPIIIAQFMNVEASNLVMLVPSLAQATLMTDFIKSEPISIVHILISLGATSAYAAVLTYIAIWLYKREQILG